MTRWKAILFGIGEAASGVTALACFIRYLIYFEISDSIASNAALVIFWCLVRLDSITQAKMEVKNKNDN